MKLFDGKTDTLFDWWSFAHFFLYFGVTKLFLMDHPFWTNIVLLLALGYVWEVIERALENLEPKIGTKRFFTEKEGWWNRYVGDPIANISGFLVAWFL